MFRIYLLAIIFCMSGLIISSCSKRHHPGKTVSETSAGTAKNNDSLNLKKAVIKPKQKEIVPKVIVVNDSVAHKSIDGRLYYDLLGQRYWKNYKDGKYYQFNKSMYTNDAFKKPN